MIDNTEKLNPLSYFYLSLIFPNRALNHKKAASPQVSVLISTLPVILFLILGLFPFYTVFEAGFGDGTFIITSGVIALIYLWAFYAAGFLVFHFMNKKMLKQPKSLLKLLHDYGVLALLTQSLLVLIAAFILVLHLIPGDASIAFVVTIPSIILVMFAYLAFAIFIFGKYLIKEENKRAIQWILVFITLQLSVAFIFLVLPLLFLRFS
ncbi:hypothetical protein [Lacicoccus alkaliphilus]|uniref:Yip1 domain-containing protein n=1 Tax=Lacicoccus alkaliphilus DSM 16010 TaxID=1123231 RepID=A0A1M7IG84_9BACL|nr:hypothetical protein [Salinicoccus alkaliphilus]SHM39761.1 hypothetical protein SAMN02745189_02086 [Salinicoccus alkaliphilus DSM 16010]